MPPSRQRKRPRKLRRRLANGVSAWLNLGGTALYALIAFGLTAPAKDLRTPAEKQRDYR